jgi:hypothetical protein
MHSYADVGVAHVDLLLVTCWEKKYPLGDNNLLPRVRPLYNSLLPPGPQVSLYMFLSVGK